MTFETYISNSHGLHWKKSSKGGSSTSCNRQVWTSECQEHDTVFQKFSITVFRICRQCMADWKLRTVKQGLEKRFSTLFRGTNNNWPGSTVGWGRGCTSGSKTSGSGCQRDYKDYGKRQWAENSGMFPRFQDLLLLAHSRHQSWLEHI